MSSIRLLPNSRGDADNIYYTGSIINNNTSALGNNPDPQASYQEIRSVPILKDANDYEVSVLKVTINGGGKSLPILIPQIQRDAILPSELPPWFSTIAYPAGTWVQYNGAYYKSKLAIAATTGGSANTNPASDTTNWNTATSFPTYSLLSTYTTGEYVIFGGKTYVAIVSVPLPTYGTNPNPPPPTIITNDPSPPNSAYWKVVTFPQVNQTIYSVTLNAVVWNPSTSALVYVTSDNVTTQTSQTPFYVQWIPENVDPGTQVPMTAFPSQVDSQYYYCYSYNHWVVLVNSTLTAAYNQLYANIRAITGLTTYTMANACPTVEFDELKKLFSFYTSTPNTAWGNYTEAQPIYAALGPPGTKVFPLAPASVTGAILGTTLTVTAGTVADIKLGGIVTGTGVTTGTQILSGPVYVSGNATFQVSIAYPTTTGSQTLTISSPEFLYVGYNINFEGLMTNFDTQYYGEDSVLWSPTASGAAYTILPYAQGGTTQSVYLPGNTLVVRNKTNTNIITPITTSGTYTLPPLFVTTQDFESVSTLWSPVGGIVLTTQLIPVRNEDTSAPVTIGSGNLNNSFSTAAFQTVLIDFTMDTMAADAWRGLISYVPTAEFYPVSMTQSHQEIKSVDFLIQWRNRLTNQLIPLTLYNTASASVRLLFRRKS